MKKVLLYSYRLTKDFYWNVQQRLYLLVHNAYYKRWYRYPLGLKKSSAANYISRYDDAIANIPSSVAEVEASTRFSIDLSFFNDLAKHIQISAKNSPADFSHGRILYCLVSSYINKLSLESDPDNISFTILETGTAKGFSSIIFAKALYDHGVLGKVISFDIIPNESSQYWNCLTDHIQNKPQTRQELLSKWSILVNSFIVFVQGDTNVTLSQISCGRINFAFLDGAHKYNDLIHEFSIVAKSQISGDVIVCDDYNINLFPGITKAIEKSCIRHNYQKQLIPLRSGRSLAVCTKV